MNELYHHGVKGMRWGVRKQEKNIAKSEKYRDKLVKKATKRSGTYKQEGNMIRSQLHDLNVSGFKSEYYKQHVRDQAEQAKRKAVNSYKEAGFSDKDANFWGGAAGGMEYVSKCMSTKEFNEYTSSLKEDRQNYIRLAKQYTNNKNALMNMKITGDTKKKDIKKVYRNNLRFYE